MNIESNFIELPIPCVDGIPQSRIYRYLQTSLINLGGNMCFGKWAASPVASESGGS